MATAGNKCIKRWLAYRFWLGMGCAIAAPSFFTPTAQAQQALPPPPSLNSLDELPSLAPVPPPQGVPSIAPGVQVPPQETVFQAPLPPPAIAPSPYSPSYQPSYRVVVNGNSPYLLQQIQQTNPTASIQDMQGNQVIVVGDYASQAEATQQVNALAQQGIAGQVLPLSGGNLGQLATASPSFAATPAFQGSHYQVVVPTRPENFAAIANKMITMGVKPEAIQAKRAPLGPHIAVGPILNEGEAESVSRYLRTGGMDARVYYSR